MTLRDRHLLGVLATARYSSSEQLLRLFFPGRVKQSAEQVLGALAGAGRYRVRRALLRALSFRGTDTARVTAWTLTATGYEFAEEVLGRVLRVPDQDIGLDFMEHTLQLNELLTALLEPAAPKRRAGQPARHPPQVFARAEFRRFRWTASEGARLPWREYDMKAGRRRERVILPDAVLELVAARRRLFLECEMGTQTIVAPAGDKPGSTVAKVERYHQYARRFSDPAGKVTFYDAQYPDGFAAEVLFLVRTDIRAEHVNQALAAWRKTCSEAPVAARALTFAQAGRELRESLGLLPAAASASGQAELGSGHEPPGTRVLSAAEADLLDRFVTDAMRGIQTGRRQIRALPEPIRLQHRLAEPSYPKDSEAAQALVHELVHVLVRSPTQNVTGGKP